MSDNIIDFSGFKKKASKPGAESYDLAMAKHLVKTDPTLSSIIDALGLSVEQAAEWMVKIADFQMEMELLIHKFSSETGHSAIFTGLVTQAMANELSDQLTTLGMSPGVTKSAFQKFQRNAISALVQAKHLEDISKDEFDTFEGDEHE